jgi:hypothetical protein
MHFCILFVESAAQTHSYFRQYHWINMPIYIGWPLLLCLNPDFAVEIVMRVESPIKTGVPARFFFESVAAPTIRRKSRKYPCLQEFRLAIDFLLQILG